MRNILLVVTAATLSGQVQSQTFSGGIRGGLNFAQWRHVVETSSIQTGAINTVFTGEARTGYVFGVYYSRMFNKSIGLQPELFYNSAGQKFAATSINLGYLSVPVFLRYNITDQFHLLGGPQIGYLLSAEGHDPGATGGGARDRKNDFHTADFGAVFGIGVDVKNFNFGLRYAMGLTNIMKNNTAVVQGASVRQNIQNVGWQLVAGYRLFGR
jgi:hypothetical protein